jgi:C-terminal processing protease CtpA/Prc
MTPTLDRMRWLAALALSAGSLALAPRIVTHSAAPARRAEPVGLTIADTRDKSGFHGRPVITSLMSGGMAARAGIAVGDHVLAVDGRPVTSADAALADLHAPGSRSGGCAIRIDLRRDGAPVVATLHLCA